MPESLFPLLVFEFDTSGANIIYKFFSTLGLEHLNTNWSLECQPMADRLLCRMLHNIWSIHPPKTAVKLENTLVRLDS